MSQHLPLDVSLEHRPGEQRDRRGDGSDDRRDLNPIATIPRGEPDPEFVRTPSHPDGEGEYQRAPDGKPRFDADEVGNNVFHDITPQSSALTGSAAGEVISIRGMATSRNQHGAQITNSKPKSASHVCEVLQEAITARREIRCWLLALERRKDHVPTDCTCKIYRVTD